MRYFKDMFNWCWGRKEESINALNSIIFYKPNWHTLKTPFVSHSLDHCILRSIKQKCWYLRKGEIGLLLKWLNADRMRLSGTWSERERVHYILPWQRMRNVKGHSPDRSASCLMYNDVEINAMDYSDRVINATAVCHSLSTDPTLRSH